MLKSFILVCVLVFSNFATAADSAYGIFMVVKGDVKVQSQVATATPAKIGGKVLSGETIVTGADARAKVVMSDKNVINISPDSVLKIDKYENDAATGKKNVSLSLAQGKVRANVEQKYDGDKSKFTIRTPTAVAGVRGTQFMTSFNPSTRISEIVTFKGAVTFSSLNAQGQPAGTPVVVKKGESTSAMPGAAPSAPKVMPKEDLRKMDSDSTASNMKKESDVKVADQKNTEKNSDKKSTSRDGASRSPASTAGAAVAAAPPPMKMVDQKDLTAAPDFRMPASATDPAGGASGNLGAVAPPPMAMLPPPSNPLLNTIISNKISNVNLTVVPVPK